MTRGFIINQGLFQLAWPACVVGAAWGLAGWTGLLAVGVMAGYQLHATNRHRNDLTMVGICVVAGFILDTAWIQSGLLRYAMPWPSEQLAPFWIGLLWIAFALVINHSMRVFKQRLLAVSLLAGIGSPMSYFAASRLGAVEWLAPAWQVVVATGVSWALLTPLLFRLARRAPSADAQRTRPALERTAP